MSTPQLNATQNPFLYEHMITKAQKFVNNNKKIKEKI